MKHIRDYLSEMADEWDKRRGIQSPYARDANDLDAFCAAERHKECMSPTCGCACHTKEKITPLKDLLNQDLFK